MADFTGISIAHFRIESKLGEGGMGVVYRATDEKLRRTVALKVLPEDFAKDDDRRQRFLREARVAAGITHRNVVTIYDVGEADGRIYIAMELVSGQTLRQLLRGFALPIDDALHIARGVARALAKAHDQGIVHRDLKPDNVVVGEDLDPKVLDFGLARPFEPASDAPKSVLGNQATVVEATQEAQITSEGGVLGTPGYMSPEQAAGRPLDSRTDVFAFGVMLYEMVTGARPFRGDSAMEIIIATSRDTPRAPSTLNGEVSPLVESVILRCLEKRPSDRYMTAGDVLRALDDRGSGASVRPPPRSVPPDVIPVQTPQPVVEASNPPPAKRKQRSWTVPVVIGSLAVVAAATLGARALMSQNGAVAANAAGSSSAATNSSARVTTLTDLPLPASKNAEAVSEYAAGMQALRDDSFANARVHFGRAAELDDSMAMAHLHLALSNLFASDSSIRQAHFAKAVSRRGALGERDRGFLEALEPSLGFAEEDRKQTRSRLEKLGTRYPVDVEILDWLGLLAENAADALVLADRVIALDELDAQAWETRGRSLGALGRNAESRAAIERCTATSPASSDCYFWLAQIDGGEGRCVDAERETRRCIDRDASVVRFLPGAMVGAGRPTESVIEAQRIAEAKAPENDRRRTALDDAVRLAILRGDFSAAREQLKSLGAIIEANVDSPRGRHELIAMFGVDLALEIGDQAEAARIAQRFVARSDTWRKVDSAGSGIAETVRLTHRAMQAGALTLEEFVTRRKDWIETRRRSGEKAPLIWTFAYAAPAETSEEAREALEALPAYEPLQWFPAHLGEPSAEIGRVYLLAGKLDEAKRWLSTAAADCAVYDTPFQHMRALVDLGDVLERAGDKKGACEAHRKVIDRWGKAKPRSATAEKAKSKSKSLDCH